MTMYPGPVPTGQQRPHTFMATPGLYVSPGPLSGPQQHQQEPLYQQVIPSLGWNPWLGASWDQQSLTNSFNSMCSTRLLPRYKTGWWTLARRTTPLHQLVIFLLFILCPRPIIPLSL
jgi:hypothetical protein